MKEKIDGLQKKLNDEINYRKDLTIENEVKKKDIINFEENLSKLKDVYENKISILNQKINDKENYLNELNNSLNNKELRIKQLNGIINDEKNKSKNLNNKIELLNQQNINYKKNAEKIIQNKDVKIRQLQQIVNQSFSSLNHGMDNIQLAKKLDNEVQQLIQNVKKNNQNELNDI